VIVCTHCGRDLPQGDDLLGDIAMRALHAAGDCDLAVRSEPCSQCGIPLMAEDWPGGSTHTRELLCTTCAPAIDLGRGPRTRRRRRSESRGRRPHDAQRPRDGEDVPPTRARRLAPAARRRSSARRRS
jgi:hypothetical protein